MSKFIIMGLLLISSYSFAQNINESTGSKISAADAQAVLDHHNTVRKEVGVPPLTWSKELAAYAQRWADQLAQTNTFAHSPNNNYGENIFMGSGNYTVLDASKDWYSEKKGYTYRKIGADLSAGHYTQMVWRGTTQVGVGVAIAADGSIYVVADYSPAGNYVGEFPY
jgi:uncharacterized protein YkwD